MSISLIPLFHLLCLTTINSSNIKLPDPKPKEFYQYNNSNSEKIWIDYNFEDSFRSKYKKFIQHFATNNLANHGRKIPFEIRNSIENQEISQKQKQILLNNKGSYAIIKKDFKIVIYSMDDDGVLNGLVTLNNLMVENHQNIGDFLIVDWPDFSARIFHIVLKSVSYDEVEKLVIKIRKKNYNHLIGQLTNYNLDATKWGLNDILKLKNLCNGLGIEFIPEVKLLSHQEKFFKNKYPELMYNSYTYNPEHPLTKKKVNEFLSNLILEIRPKIIHVGHDEIIGVYDKFKNKKKLKISEYPLPARSFKSSILFLYNLLNSQNIEMWMWGDMFLDQSKYSNMFKWSLHGNNDYEKVLFQIPMDITIIDWHYFDKGEKFPSYDFFKNNGFKTFGATWKNLRVTRNFSNYIVQSNAKNLGMVATTWFLLQKQDWESINQIIEFSGNSFWNSDYTK